MNFFEINKLMDSMISIHNPLQTKLSEIANLNSSFYNSDCFRIANSIVSASESINTALEAVCRFNNFDLEYGINSIINEQIERNAAIMNKQYMDCFLDNCGFKDINSYDAAMNIASRLNALCESCSLDNLFSSNIIDNLEQSRAIENVIHDYNEQSGTEIIEVTDRETKEFYNDIRDVSLDERNWQQNLNDKIEKWREKNPIFYRVLSGFILSIIASIVASVLLNAFTSSKATIKERPTSNSQIVCNICVNQKLTVIGDVKYYYKVKYLEPDTGNIIIGWLSKRNVTICNNFFKQVRMDLNTPDK